MKKINIIISMIFCFIMSYCISNNKPPSSAARLANAKCGACHLVPRKGRYNEKKLKAIFYEHQKRVRLTDEEIKILYKYFILSKKSIP